MERLSFEQAKRLYYLGIYLNSEKSWYVHAHIEPTLTWSGYAYDKAKNYDGTDVYPAPTFDEFHEYMRKNKDIFISLIYKTNGHWESMMTFKDSQGTELYVSSYNNELSRNGYREDKLFPSYEEAYSEAINNILGLLECD